MTGKLKIEKSEKGNYYVRIYGEYWFPVFPDGVTPPPFIKYEGTVKKRNIFIEKYEACAPFKPSKLTGLKWTDYGADFETAVLKDGEIILPEEFGQVDDGVRKKTVVLATGEEITKQNSEAVIIAAAFIAKKKRFIYDHTRMEYGELIKFLFNKENKRLRFYNIEYDGKYILNILFQNGYKEVQDFTDGGSKEFIALKNPFGKIFSISYRVIEEDIDEVSGLPFKNTFTTTLMDTYKLFPGTSLKKGLEAFKVMGDHGKPLRKMDMGFGREHTYDSEGNMKDDFLLYMKKDAEGARRLYQTFVKTLDSTKSNFLTIGAVAWSELIDRCFGGKKENFKLVTGDIAPELEDKYRSKLYRGGYGLLNNKWYQKLATNVYHADYVSMYPAIMYHEQMPVGVGKEHKGYKAPTASRPIAVHHVKIYKASLKPGYFPILIDGRKSEFHDNYIFNVDEELETMLFEEYGTESEFSIFDRTYQGKQYEVVSSRLFEAKKDLFKDFIDYWYPIKENAPKDSPERNLAKLMLNNSFGKIGESYKKSVTYFDTNEEGEFVVLEKTDEFKEVDTRNVFIAANITHRGRVKLWLDAEKIGFDRVILLATDALFWIGETDKLEFGKTLGQLDLEDRGVEMWAFGEKAYQVSDGKRFSTKCNGMKDEVKATIPWMGLKENYEFEMLKKQNFKGGSVLIPVTLKLKPRNITNEGV